MNTPSAFLIGGTASGSGKTTLTLGIMAAFKARGLQVQPFKCGPDFIDPSLHRMVTTEISSNLDLRMCGATFCKDTFQRRFTGKDLAVVEGVMGLFDGGLASSAALAKELGLPVILVIDVRSAAESVAAVLKGFEGYDPDLKIAGVIFNRVGSVRHRELIERGVEGHCTSKIIGFFPRDIRFEIPDRHLGLHMGEEHPLDAQQVSQLVEAVETHLDLDLLLSLCRHQCPPQAVISIKPEKHGVKKVRIAVARDKAFCFYYEDNLELFAEAGIEPVFFSPIKDSDLPPDCKGIYLGGGYPELHAAALSNNSSMRCALREFATKGGIVLGECGGFMYLCDEIEDLDGEHFSMTGIFPFHISMKPRLSRLGYRSPTLQQDCILGARGEKLHGHEFHYSEISDIPEEASRLYQLANNRMEGYTVGNVIGSYIHLHFGQSMAALHSLSTHLNTSGIST
jgi:cobyrinic acid a,c-diamide synthase